jgi:hypothetical protein
LSVDEAVVRSPSGKLGDKEPNMESNISYSRLAVLFVKPGNC